MVYFPGGDLLLWEESHTRDDHACIRSELGNYVYDATNRVTLDSITTACFAILASKEISSWLISQLEFSSLVQSAVNYTLM